MPVHRSLNKDIFKTWSPGVAYLLGYFAADGSMLRNSRGACFIEFHSTDRELLEMVQGIAGSNHALTERPVRNKKWKPLYRLQIGSKEWFGDLTSLGFTQRKSHHLVFPSVPKKFLSAFVRGYFDGDGCVHFKEYWSKEKNKDIWVFLTLFTSGSRQFLESLHHHLKNNGIVGGRINEKERGYDLVFSRHDSLALHHFMYNTGQVDDYFLPRKRQKMEQAIQALGLSTCGRSSTG